jgi:hypothetical protein
MFDLYLHHGRDDPAADMDEFGYEGPRLSGVVGIHETYSTHLHVIFSSPKAADEAEAATGWERWDTDRLCAPLIDGLVRCGTGGAGALSYFGDWGLIEPETAKAARLALGATVRRALAFVEGFEGDELQEGIDGPGGLLEALRAAAGPDPMPVPRQPFSVPDRRCVLGLSAAAASALASCAEIGFEGVGEDDESACPEWAADRAITSEVEAAIASLRNFGGEG